MILRVRRLGELEDRDGYGLECVERAPARLCADDRGGEQERRRLAGDARNGEHGTGHDAADRLRQDDAQGRAPARNAQREARLAQRARHECEHLHRRARDEWEHQAGERERSCVAALAVAEDKEAVDEDADDDRGNAVEDVEREADRLPDGDRGVLA